jgi:hypothetical protein
LLRVLADCNNSARHGAGRITNPTASMTAMFAVEYKIYTDESDATIPVAAN